MPGRCPRGFTLIEVMVAIALMAIIMTLIWSSTSQSLRAKERVEGRDMVFHSGGTALRKISEDLVMAFLAGTVSKPTGFQMAQSGGQGASSPAAVEPFKTFFMGKDESEADELAFTSLSHQRLFKNAKESDQCKVAYQVVPGEDDSTRMDLVRREDPWLDSTTEVKADPIVLVEGIRSFNVEYYEIKKAEWVKNWNTEQQEWQGRLPTAVRVSISFADPDDDQRTIPMSTAVTVPLSGGAIDFQ